jgi:hypothetical protein
MEPISGISVVVGELPKISLVEVLPKLGLELECDFAYLAVRVHVDCGLQEGGEVRYFTGPTFEYEWSEVDCKFMDEVIIDIGKRTGNSGGAQGRPRTLGAGSVFSWLFHQPPQTSSALIIVDVGHHLCSQLCVHLTLCRE